MAAGQSKGSSSPHPKGGEKSPTSGERRPKATAPAGAPTDKVKMGWLAMRYDLGGSYLLGGVPFSFPVVSNKLFELGAPEDDNVLIVPCPEGLAEGLADTHRASCKQVKGKLPDLTLHPVKVGNNQELVSNYLDAHPPRFASVANADWNKPIHLPKAS